jgi:pimeloyl-ACP methyl ester carboxylesterase
MLSVRALVLAVLAPVAACAAPRASAPPAPAVPHAAAEPATPAALPPHRVRRIAVDPLVSLEVLDWGGSGPPLVFLAGLGNTGHAFDTFAPRFTDRFHVVAVTRRGLGASDRPYPGPYDAQTLAADVKAVVDSLGFGKVTLVGHSYGGTEASWFAALYPDRVDAVVYLDSYCNGCTGAVADFRAAHPREPPVPPMAAEDTLTVAGSMAYQRRTVGYSLPEDELRAMYVIGADGSVRPAVPPWVAAGIVRGASHPGFARIHARVLGIFAERSTPREEFWWYPRMSDADQATARAFVRTMLPLRRAAREQFARELPNARVAVVEGATHFVFLSHPDETERLMREFFGVPARTPTGGVAP